MEAYIRQPRLLEERLERGCSEVAEGQRLTGRGGEHEVVFLPEASSFEPLCVLSRLVGSERFDCPPA